MEFNDPFTCMYISLVLYSVIPCGSQKKKVTYIIKSNNFFHKIYLFLTDAFLPYIVITCVLFMFMFMFMFTAVL
jgi:hypothetical protein